MANRSLESLVGEKKISLKDKFLSYCSSLYSGLNTRNLHKNTTAYGSSTYASTLLQGLTAAYCYAVAMAVGLSRSIPFILLGGINLDFALSHAR